MIRKMPKTESLHDCMARTLPYFKEQIYPQATVQGKRVFISSSENAIRGLLMYLCEMPEEKVTELEIPNGLPIIFDTKSKCVKVSESCRQRVRLLLFASQPDHDEIAAAR